METIYLAKKFKDSIIPPPPGKDRDLYIAYLKGIKKAYIDPEISETNLYVIPSNKPYRTHSIDAACLPTWSTDRYNAWSLWDDMRKNGYMLTFMEDDGDESVIVFSRDGFRQESIMGINFADCISQAWIWFKINTIGDRPNE